MKSILIYTHSLLDLVTNSSSETFVTADHGTVSAIKSMINELLKLGGNTKTCDDLFNITLYKAESYYGYYSAIHVTSKAPENDGVAAMIETLQKAFVAEEIGND
jgi:hypothetical protein